MSNGTQPRHKPLICRFSAATIGFFLINALVIAVVLMAGSNLPGASVAQDVQINNLGQTPMYGCWSWWSAHAFFEEERVPDVVLLGSSLVNSAAWAADALTLYRPIDCAVHHRVVTLERALTRFTGLTGVDRPHAINCAIGGAVASDYYFMSRALFNGDRKPKLIVLGVAPRDFIDNKVETPCETEPFLLFSRYVDFDSKVSRAFSSPLERFMSELDWRFDKLPLRRLHPMVTQFFTEEGAFTQRTMPANQLLAALSNGALTVRPGQVIVPFTVSDTWHDNTEEYARRYKNPWPRIYRDEMYFFEQTLKYLKSRDIKVLVVEMPTLPCNRSLLPQSFWSKYATELRTACLRQQIDFVDLSAMANFPKSDYVDTVHVNWYGGIKALNLIAKTIASRPHLASSLQPIDLADKRQNHAGQL